MLPASKLAFGSLMHFHGCPGLVLCIAERLNGTIRAPWLACETQIASVMNHLVRVQSPTVLRDDLHQVLFDFYRISVFGEFPAARNALHMRVDHHAHALAEP